MRTLRVMTYNLRGLRHGVDLVAQAISSCAPDVVLVQESGPRRSFRRLASRVGMHRATDPWSPFRRRIKNALLVRPPLAIASRRLHRFAPLQRWYPRGALVAAIEGPQVALTTVSTHLGVRPRDRRRHVEELLELTGALPRPMTLGGDFNEGPDGVAVTRTSAVLVDAWVAAGDGLDATFPASEPGLRIDYVFVSPKLVPIACRVPTGREVAGASDHLPVVADLSIAD